MVVTAIFKLISLIIGGLASFKGQWSDLTPYLSQSAYDLSVYDPATLEFFKQDGVQIGVPFDLYPSMLWYKRDFFQEAGLAEPPHEFGAKYKMADGSEVDWNYDTLRQIAMKLIGFDRGVTMLGGYPFPICTPAHGTAYDIAGRGIANVSASREALLLAIRMAEQVRAGEEANPALLRAFP